MTKDYRTVPTDEVIGTLSADRRARIKDRADELIAEEFSHLKGRVARRIEDLDDATIEAIAKAEVPAEFDHLDKATKD